MTMAKMRATVVDDQSISEHLTLIVFGSRHTEGGSGVLFLVASLVCSVVASDNRNDFEHHDTMLY